MTIERVKPFIFLALSGLLLTYGVLGAFSGDLWLPFKHGWTHLSGASALTFILGTTFWLIGSVVICTERATNRQLTIAIGSIVLGSALLVAMHWVPGAVSCQTRSMDSCRTN